LGISFKNRLINGAMVISQYNGTSSVSNLAGALTWSVDRWKANCGAANKFTMQQNAGSVTPPAGFSNYLGLTSSSAYTSGSSDYFYLSQTIEGYNIADLNWGTANAKTITVSFWVRASVTGTYGGIIINSNGTANYPFSFTVNASNTWQYITITVVGPTFGTWNSTNGSGLEFRFDLGNGSDYTTGTAGVWSASFGYPSGTVKLVATNGGTLYLTGTQIEVGTQATTFDYRSYGTELSLCQRYFWRISAVTSGNYCAVGSGVMFNSTQAQCYLKYPTTMRTSPTISILITGGMYVNTGDQCAVYSIADQYSGIDSARVNLTVSTSVARSGAMWWIGDTTGSYVQGSAEL
jgi:hypothetical protein